MEPKNSKSERLYEEIKRAILTGRYTPGARIDPSTLANEFKISPTPVRFALYRLVGEGVIEDHAREGFHVHQCHRNVVTRALQMDGAFTSPK